MSTGTSVFWGCTISQRLPYLESTIRKVFQLWGITPRDIEGLSCCPDPLYAKTLPHMNYLSLSARNLALAEKAGGDLLTMCNGCYKVLKGAQIELRDKGQRDAVNKTLRQCGLQYKNGAAPIHLIEYLSRLSKQELKKHLQKSLSGLSVGVHYGCHILRPRNIAVDSVHKPVLMEKLLEYCGVKIVDYEDELLCCGGTLAPFDAASSQGLLKRKLANLQRAGADCLVVVCPSCFIQYDVQSRSLKDKERLPVFHLMELLALACGIPAEELNFQRHSVKVAPVLDKVGISYRQPELEKYFDLKRLSECCGACTYECTVAKSQPDSDTMSFDPQAIVQKIVSGRIEEAIASPDIWKCLGCYECAVFCPNNVGLGSTFETLRQLAVERGIVPEIAKSRMDLLAQTGRETKGSESARKRMGLPASASIQVEEVQCLLQAQKSISKRIGKNKNE